MFESAPTRNTENNERLANRQHQTGANLKDPQSLAGTNTPDGGTYGYPNEPRGADTEAARFAEDVTGLPTGLEINLGGTHQGNGRIDGGIWLDGVRIETDRVTGASVSVYVEVKYWENYSADLPWVPPSIGYNLNNQLSYLPTGARLEWVVSNDTTAQAVREQIQRSVQLEDQDRIQVTVHSPRR